MVLILNNVSASKSNMIQLLKMVRILSHGVSNGGHFFLKCILVKVINSYTDLVTFHSSLIKDTFTKRKNHEIALEKGI